MPCSAPHEIRNASCDGPTGSEPKKCWFCKHVPAMKTRVLDRRASVYGMVTNGDRTGAQLQQAWADRLELMLKDIFKEAIGNNPPSPYAICLAGSGARQEASPFSDVDTFILVEDDAPNVVKYFQDVCHDKIFHMFHAIDKGGGLRFCTIMTPLGGDTPKTPALIKTPEGMAELLELTEDQIEGHILGGLQEHRFLHGKKGLYDQYVVDTRNILGQRSWEFWSRPNTARRKNLALKQLEHAVRSPDFQPPPANARIYHVKNQFYRLPQFVCKCLAWYYDVQEMNTLRQLEGLVQNHHMSNTVANNFRTILDIYAKLRFTTHLETGGERDYVYVTPEGLAAEKQKVEDRFLNHDLSIGGKRDDRILKDQLKPELTHQLTNEEHRALKEAIACLKYILRLSERFVSQKKKPFGKRHNTFLTG